MPTVAVYDITGAQTGEMELSDAVFGVAMNTSLVHQAVVRQLANQRLGTAATKTRGMVRGGGRKPWRQKGTGRARAGTIRSPLWVGGGTVFGPHPRSYAQAMPRKARRLAIKCALSAKVRDNELIVVEDLTLAEAKTKRMAETLHNLKAAAKALIILPQRDDTVERSARNIPGVKTITTLGLNVHDILRHGSLVLTKDAVAKIEEVLA